MSQPVLAGILMLIAGIFGAVATWLYLPGTLLLVIGGILALVGSSRRTAQPTGER
ncbi:MAG: hypothetical protein K6V36_15835 [Anaerolineae bacterium]|nr:hypothetical protein [Anaerolineae bacterium]